MNHIRINRSRRTKGAEINMAPLIDMIFILLIFFLVTTSFVKQSAVEIQRPSAQSAEKKEKVNLMVEVSENGSIFIEGQHTDIRFLSARIKRFAAETPGGSILIAADRQSQTGLIINILDQCRMAGIDNISVAAKKSETRE
ncbi:Putative Biopolymer transporter, ExbD/TolR-like [Desulfonema limicola]|uniref:Biopolymer transporter, ExbD/TolR-like n=1 Tax=Desulfonema limicola TaxID=45656 RepID=A0A975BEN2_9BACT|nr:biopolymer transporter ExbD [Desulfonema limicola]QTA83754.1 Putative Biopolymer transporter, ExbD/TolR-like [Desulfonema limicola]